MRLRTPKKSGIRFESVFLVSLASESHEMILGKGTERFREPSTSTFLQFTHCYITWLLLLLSVPLSSISLFPFLSAPCEQENKKKNNKQNRFQ